MGVDHGRGDVGMTQQFLHCAYVMVGFEKVSGKTVSKRMAAHSFSYLCQVSCFFYSSPKGAFKTCLYKNISALSA
jgi:hypothetical protein